MRSLRKRISDKILKGKAVINVQRGIECSNVNCDVPFCDRTFPVFILFYFYFLKAVWMKLFGWEAS